jgi:hypothetical protein
MFREQNLLQNQLRDADDLGISINYTASSINIFIFTYALIFEDQCIVLLLFFNSVIEEVFLENFQMFVSNLIPRPLKSTIKLGFFRLRYISDKRVISKSP